MASVRKHVAPIKSLNSNIESSSVPKSSTSIIKKPVVPKPNLGIGVSVKTATTTLLSKVVSNKAAAPVSKPTVTSKPVLKSPALPVNLAKSSKAPASSPIVQKQAADSTTKVVVSKLTVPKSASTAKPSIRSMSRLSSSKIVSKAAATTPKTGVTTPKPGSGTIHANPKSPSIAVTKDPVVTATPPTTPLKSSTSSTRSPSSPLKLASGKAAGSAVSKPVSRPVNKHVAPIVSKPKLVTSNDSGTVAKRVTAGGVPKPAGKQIKKIFSRSLGTRIVQSDSLKNVIKRLPEVEICDADTTTNSDDLVSPVGEFEEASFSLCSCQPSIEDPAEVAAAVDEQKVVEIAEKLFSMMPSEQKEAFASVGNNEFEAIIGEKCSMMEEGRGMEPSGLEKDGLLEPAFEAETKLVDETVIKVQCDEPVLCEVTETVIIESSRTVEDLAAPQNYFADRETSKAKEYIEITIEHDEPFSEVPELAVNIPQDLEIEDNLSTAILDEPKSNAEELGMSPQLYHQDHTIISQVKEFLPAEGETTTKQADDLSDPISKSGDVLKNDEASTMQISSDNQIINTEDPVDVPEHYILHLETENSVVAGIQQITHVLKGETGFKNNEYDCPLIGERAIENSQTHLSQSAVLENELDFHPETRQLGVEAAKPLNSQPFVENIKFPAENINFATAKDSSRDDSDNLENRNCFGGEEPTVLIDTSAAVCDLKSEEISSQLLVKPNDSSIGCELLSYCDSIESVPSAAILSADHSSDHLDIDFPAENSTVILTQKVDTNFSDQIHLLFLEEAADAETLNDLAETNVSYAEILRGTFHVTGQENSNYVDEAIIEARTSTMIDSYDTCPQVQSLYEVLPFERVIQDDNGGENIELGHTEMDDEDSFENQVRKKRSRKRNKKNRKSCANSTLVDSENFSHLNHDDMYRRAPFSDDFCQNRRKSYARYNRYHRNQFNNRSFQPNRDFVAAPHWKYD